MSKKYTQVAETERYSTDTMKERGYSNTGVVTDMGRDDTTTRNDLHRNSGQCGYRHQQAQP